MRFKERNRRLKKRERGDNLYLICEYATQRLDLIRLNLIWIESYLDLSRDGGDFVFLSRKYIQYVSMRKRRITDDC